MRLKEFNLGAVILTAVLAAASAPAQNAPELSLTRFDCGKTTTLNDVSRFSDVAAFKGLNIELTFSCYLVKHGNDYLIWDTGNPAATALQAECRCPSISSSNTSSTLCTNLTAPSG